MRFRVTAAVLSCGLAFSAEALAQHDFDPSGRRHAPRPPARPQGTARPTTGKPDKKKPASDELIERYTKALLASPTSAFPLQKLSELYRTRDGNLDKLVRAFEALASAPAGDAQLNARIALAGVYLAASKRDEAIRVLDDLSRSHPSLATPRMMRAALAERDGDKSAARRQYEAALPLLRDTAERERVTRQLMILALDLGDLAAASARHEELVRLSGGSVFVRKELALELMNRGQYGAAEAKLRDVVRASAGDNRALAPALRDLGEALARQKKLDEALTVLERARVAAGGQTGIRNEILAILTDVYREQGKLPDLIALLEKEGGRDGSRLATMAQLLEETGQVEAAIKRYREALAVDGKNGEMRLRLVHLLQTTGQLDDAVREYEALTKAAPDNAEYVFELAETWLQRGEREKALALLAELERRADGKGDVLGSVADFYERMEEPARALRVFERLATTPDGDPRYLVDLGERYYQAGDRARALTTWKRILSVTQTRSDGLVALGEVYLEHELIDEALEALRDAVKLAPPGKSVRYKKSLAAALERAGGAGTAVQARYREALALWQELLSNAADDPLLARDCRNHLVGIWALSRELEGRVAPLRAKLDGNPPDLEAGRLLAEVQRRLGRSSDAELTLRKLVKLAPGDVNSMLVLERVLVVQRNLTGALEVLARLVEADPKKAREYYQRMAQYAAELYRDEDAIAYASRALELSPDDAEGHVRLAAMHRRRQENARAMHELRKAIVKNPRLHRAYFELAELAIAAGDIDEADRLYRHVVRSARDEEFVVRAARLSMQIHLGRGTLDTLEHELLPVALGNPQKAVYRRVLVEVYRNLAAPLVQAARFGSGAEREQAKKKLAAIGSRAVKPLLDALVDDAAAQQRIALEVLGYVENKGAGPALFNFALGSAEVDLRVRAMVACGALSDSALLPRFEEFLAPKASEGVASGSDPVAVAATWGVARMLEPKAEPLLKKLVLASNGEVRALAALGLGLAKKSSYGGELARLTRMPEAGAVVRAAATMALGELEDASQRPLLLALTESPEVEVRLAALSSLARLEQAVRAPKGRASSAVERLAPDFATVLARSLWSEDARVRARALAAAAAVTSGTFRREGSPFAPLDGSIASAAWMERLAPSGYSRDDESRALAALAEPLGAAASTVLATSPEGAVGVATLLLGSFGGLLRAEAVATPEPETDRRLEDVVEVVSRSTLAGFVALASHPSFEVRRRALAVVSRRSEPEARAAVVMALEPSQPSLASAVLASLSSPRGEEIVTAILGLLEAKGEWSLRAHAAEALGRAALDDARLRSEVEVALVRVASRDPFALVREAALRAAFARAAVEAPALAARVIQTDEEPALRALAAELLRSTSNGASPRGRELR